MGKENNFGLRIKYISLLKIKIIQFLNLTSIKRNYMQLYFCLKTQFRHVS